MTRRAGVTITPEAHQALRTLAGLASGLAERPVNMSDAIVAVIPVVREHADEYRMALTTGKDSSP